jgi:hypothetical protein
MAKASATKPRKPRKKKSLAPPATSPQTATSDRPAPDSATAAAGSTAPPNSAAPPPTQAELLILALASEQTEALDRLEELEREFDELKTEALEAKHAVKQQQDRCNKIAREIRQVERTGRCDRQPTLFQRQEQAERIERGKQIAAAVATDKPPTDTDIASHVVSVLDIPVPWVEKLEEQRIKTIGDLQAKIAAGQFTRAKAKGFAPATRSELLDKLDAYVLKHTVPNNGAAASSDGGSGAKEFPVPLKDSTKHKATILVKRMADGKFKAGFEYSWSYGPSPHVFENPERDVEAFAVELEALIRGGNLLREKWDKSGDKSRLKDEALEQLDAWHAGHVEQYEQLLEKLEAGEDPDEAEGEFGEGLNETAGEESQEVPEADAEAEPGFTLEDDDAGDDEANTVFGDQEEG